MPGVHSVGARSVAGDGPPAQRRRTSLSAAIRIDSVVAGGLGSLAAQRRQLDQDYVIEQVRASPDDVVESLATLFRSGTLLRSLNLSRLQQGEDLAKGALLAPKVRTFKGLFDVTLDALLQCFEKEVFTTDLLQQLSRTEKKELITYSLNVCETAPLPGHQEALRYTVVLCVYLKVFYDRFGKRLSQYRLADKATFGYIGITGEAGQQKIVVQCPGRNNGLELDCPILSVVPDACVARNLTQRPIVTAKSVNAVVRVVDDYNKNKAIDQFLFEPLMTEVPVLAEAEVPPFCTSFFNITVADEEAQQGGSQDGGADRRAPPPGRGTAKAAAAAKATAAPAAAPAAPAAAAPPAAASE
eukprot:TRINITY_DN83801_c0_g1_i1.p1 TRINITY_DN83801_c0_g1~~TRINITY_DN83801_c0_g1_i1.p1  ORF type:complete len:356 (-),score=115.69 TRINITY_DN83801_c0_g1_i1:329-1396(-)